MTTYRLKEDHHSTVNNKVLYAEKGEKVTLVVRHDHVMIVEGRNGRFPVPENKLTN